MNEREMKENKMGVLPVGRLLLSMSVPIMLSMLVQALYNIVDSVFVSRISENALNAVSLAFPVQNLMIAVAIGTGVGINALLSKSLGEKNYERANLAAVNGVFLGVCSAAAFAVLGLLFSRTFFTVQTDVAEIVEGGAAYVWVCTVCSPGIFISISFERLLQATGRTVYSMISQMVGAVVNIIFDPIFIFVLGMGVVGAAWATVLGQVVGAALGVYFNATRNPEITVKLRGFRPNRAIISRIYSVGVPSIIATIGTQFFWRGAVMLMSQGLALGLADLTDSPVRLALVGRLGGHIPMQALWLLALAGVLWLVLNRHPLGDAVRFTGEQADVASRLGIDVPRARLGVHTLMGGIAGLAGAVGCMEMGSWWPTQGDGYMLLVFAAVFIGGTSVFGGSGKVYGTLVGIAIVGMIEAGIVSSGLSGFWTRAVHGMVIVVSVSAYAVLSGNADERLLRLLRRG